MVGDRFLASGDEAGTAPGDRHCRPDVEGLRAVAVLLVVLFHAGVPGLRGGYIGVDVFFVISGFVITGVLLRERAVEHRTSILAFYGRRCRRIIPAATLVIIVTAVAAYAVLGVVGGDRTAVDGRWAAVFLANFHFASVGTNYLTATLPPSPLQNYWSLAVEEQFYLVYPTLFALVAWMSMRVAFRIRMATGLIVVIVASFTLSVLQTATESTVAYFSPFTRAWELALGALVAVSTPVLLRMSRRLAASMTWVGLAAILMAAFWFTSNTAYPGWHVAIPVIGSALVIAAGTVAPHGGATPPPHLSIPAFGTAFLLPLPVALADPDLGRRISRQVDASVVTGHGMVAAVIGGVRGDVPPRRESDPAFQVCPWSPMGQRGVGSGTRRDHTAHSDRAASGEWRQRRCSLHSEGHRRQPVDRPGPTTGHRIAGRRSIPPHWCPRRGVVLPGVRVPPQRRPDQHDRLHLRGPSWHSHHGDLRRFARCHVVPNPERHCDQGTVEVHHHVQGNMPDRHVAFCKSTRMGCAGWGVASL